MPKEHTQAAQKVRKLMAKYHEVELLVKIGEYKQGADPEADEAIAKMPAIKEYLQQGLGEKPTYDDAVQQLQNISMK